MSFPGEIMDLYAEGAAGMTATINEKMTRAVTVSHYGNVRSFLLPLDVKVLNCTMLNVIHLPCGHTVIIIITK